MRLKVLIEKESLKKLSKLKINLKLTQFRSFLKSDELIPFEVSEVNDTFHYHYKCL